MQRKQLLQAGENRRVPTVSRVTDDTIIELVYDPSGHKTGLAVSRFDGLWNIEQDVKIGTGEVLVPYSADNNLIANGCVLLPDRPEHHGDKTELLSAVTEFLHRYVDLPPLFEKIAAHYVLLTWVHDAFSELPYIRLLGDYGTGKTRALLAIGSLCYRPFFANGASTVSPLFHTMDRFGGTLVFDEADFRTTDATSEITKILNNGNVKGFPVLRSVQNSDREYNPRAFRVYGPKLVAMRGRFDDPALESRFLTGEMSRKNLRSDVPIATPPTLYDEARALRNRLLHYRFCTLFHIEPDPTVLNGELEPRVNQIAQPLLSLVDSADLRVQIVQLLKSDQDSRRTLRRSSIEARVLSILREEGSEAKGTGISIGTIADRFNADYRDEYGGGASARQIGIIVRKALGLSTVKSNGQFVVPKSEKPRIDDLWSSYT